MTQSGHCHKRCPLFAYNDCGNRRQEEDRHRHGDPGELCKELKADPTEARVKLRAAVAAKKIKHAGGQASTWPKGSPALKSVREILKGDKD
jgi:hypothetical protein